MVSVFGVKVSGKTKRVRSPEDDYVNSHVTSKHHMEMWKDRATCGKLSAASKSKVRVCPNSSEGYDEPL